MTTDTENENANLAAVGLLQKLRAAKRFLREKLNDHQLVDVLIEECIEHGFDQGSRIIGIVKHLGFNPSHVGIRLSKGTGDDPTKHRWRREADGSYTVHRRPCDTSSIVVPRLDPPAPITEAKPKVSAKDIRIDGTALTDGGESDA
jgi:hypothetical protein